MCHFMKWTVGSQFIANSIPHSHSSWIWQLAFFHTKDNLHIISAKSGEGYSKLFLLTNQPGEKITHLLFIIAKLLHNEVLKRSKLNKRTNQKALLLNHSACALCLSCLWCPEAKLHLGKYNTHFQSQCYATSFWDTVPQNYHYERRKMFLGAFQSSSYFLDFTKCSARLLLLHLWKEFPETMKLKAISFPIHFRVYS